MEFVDFQFKQLIDKMVLVLDLLCIKVYIYEIELINGFVVFDGCIFIMCGFYKCYFDGDVMCEELVFVIVYELGYVVLGYLWCWMIDFLGQNVLCMVLVMVLSCFIFWVGVWIVNMLMIVLVVCLLCNDEYEVDEYVVVLLIKVGIGIELQKFFFYKFEKIIGVCVGVVLVWLLSYLKMVEWIVVIEKLEQKWGVV